MQPHVLEVLPSADFSAEDAAAEADTVPPRGPTVLIDDNACDLTTYATRVAELPGSTELLVRSSRAPGEWLNELSELRGLLCLDIPVPAGADPAQTVQTGGGVLAGIVTLTKAAREAGLTVRWLIPLTPDLVYRLDMLTSFAVQNGAKPVIVPAAALDANGTELRGDDRIFAWDFVTYRMLGEEIDAMSQTEISAYRALRDWLLKPTPPPVTGSWARVSKDGTEIQDRTVAALSASLMALAPPDAPLGISAKDRMMTAVDDLVDVLTVGLPAHLRKGFVSRADTPRPDAQMENVLLIGAYGGEHIGDGAILGGVLYRIHARHGTKRAILMTQRPYHTRHLIPMLDVPVDVQVQEYTPGNIRAALAQVDGVVFAGGPLTDLPKQLVRHLETVTRARRKGLPFVMEGIGPGEFPRKASAVTARRITTLADRIAVRVKDGVDKPVVARLDLEVGRDPAFDYLETLGPVLTRLSSHEPAQIDQMLAGTEDHLVIAVNVRPIGHMYTPSQPGRDPVAYTRNIETQCETELARGLVDFAKASERPVTYVFFPMNAIQFGMSDLRSAWRIAHHLPADLDFRIWQADASLDGVVYLLRRADAAISMRFHGAIFALSQGLPVIGIDYRIGKRDKVAAVLADVGQEENCARIDTLKSDWLVDRLTALTSAKA
ncbi:MAG: polysaccharide pyruvyl transferase family protein [Marinibacterium sp.]